MMTFPSMKLSIEGVEMKVSSGFSIPRAWDLLRTPEEAECLVWWKTFFRFAYYLGVYPYHVKWDPRTRAWYPVKHRAQRIFCIIQQIVIFWQYLSEPKGVSQGSPALFYFVLMVQLSFGYYLVVQIIFAWTSQTAVLSVFNQVQAAAGAGPRAINIQSILNGRLRKTKRTEVVSKAVCAIFALFPFLNLARLLEDTDWLQNGPVTSVRVYQTTQKMFFLPTEPTLDRNPYLVGFTIICSIYVRIGGYYSDLLFVTSSVFFRQLATEFIAELNKGSVCPEYQMLVVQHFRSLKQTLHLINKAAGHVNFVVTVGALPYYCEIGISLFSTTPVFTRAKVIIYAMYFLSSLLVAADAHKKIGEALYDWLFTQRNFALIPQAEMSLLLYDMSQDNLGLSSGQTRTISYGFLGQMFGLVITYVVVFFQFSVT